MAVRRIAEQADRAGQVIRSVHDFVRRRDRTREAVTPQALVDAVLPLVRLQARKLGVRVELAFEDHLPAVVCDRTLVEQVLLNLARNGMQAMDMPELSERVLRLRVVRASGSSPGPEARRWLEFSVADLGCGISDDVASRLFTPFFTTRSDGMGLGLSLCRTVVEQHGGVLMHEPQRPRGTIFRFTLATA
jgi:two-component system sensor histidine kinase DctS